MISADAITSRTFTTVRFKEGYSAREVDDFLDEIVDRMATDDHSLARRIKEKTFSNVRFREGYDIDEVDDFLDEVARGLEGDAGASTGASTASAAAAIPDPHETVAPEPGTSYTSDANLAAPSVRQQRGRSCLGDGCAGVSLKDRGSRPPTAAPRSYLLVVVFAERFVSNFQ